jgi:hypothetical protein
MRISIDSPRRFALLRAPAEPGLSISTLAAAALVLMLGACAGGSPDPVARKCTKSLYELCITEHDCMSNNCLEFAADGYQICTVGCTDAVPCPDLNGEPVTCTDNVCKPSAPVECEVVP